MRKRKPVLLNGEALMADGKVLEFDAVDQEELDGKIDAPQTAQVGEVLTVEEVDEDGKPTKWKAAKVSGTFVCTFNDGEDGWITCDKTVEEIITANNDGKDVIGHYYDEIYRLSTPFETGGGYGNPIFSNLGVGVLSIIQYDGGHFGINRIRLSDIAPEDIPNSYEVPVYVPTRDGMQWQYGRPLLATDYVMNELTDEEKALMQKNLGIDALSLVKYTEQELTDEEQVQARKNIRAKPIDFPVTITSTTINGVTSYTADKNFSEVLSACKDGATVVINYNNIIIPMVDFSDSQISFMISLYGFATINVFLREGDNDVCNVTLYRSPYYEFSAVYVNFMDGESEGLLDADYTYNELCDEIDYARNIYGYYQDRELTLTKHPYPEDGDLAYYSFTGVNQIDDKVYFERIDYKKDGTITYQKKEIGADIDVMTGSSFDSDGTSGLVPTPPKWTSGDGDNLFLNCKGLWKPVIYKESWVNIASLCMTNDFPKIAIVIKGTSSVSGMVPNEESGLMFYVRENGPSLIFFMIGESGKSYYVSYDRQSQSYGTVEGKYSFPSPTTAQVGQVVKAKAVDDNGKITETETVDIPMQKTLKWITVHSSDLTETKRELIISTDTDGKSIVDYNPVGLSLIVSTPADATVESNNGSPWVYPSATKADNAIRVIGNISGWKTVARDSAFVFNGGSSAMSCSGNVNTSLATYKLDGYALDGVRIFFNSANDHLPVGTHVEVAILCEVE